MSTRKHFILTHPFHGNYGGMLQAWALWCSLTKIQLAARIALYPSPFPRLSLCGHIMRLCRNLQYALQIIPFNWPWRKRSSQCCANSFVKSFREGVLTEDDNPGAGERLSATYIVGSDQVWRACYARDMRSVPFFFLDFLPENARRRCIAYAASFGTDEWEGTVKETEICRGLLKQFKTVSTRELSGVKLCRDVFGVEAVQMPDPTFLVELEDYDSIITSERTQGCKAPYIAAYVLDESPDARSALQNAAEALGLQVQYLMPSLKSKLKQSSFPFSVPQWLRFMKEANFVVTDSFHGCVFSIIFNRPFVCLGNIGRGSARFDTLFQTFHLESRFATSPEQVAQIACVPIDWEKVNAISRNERARGLAFLRENLL